MLLKELKPKVAGFTETHITRNIEDHELRIDGYICVRGDSDNRTGGVLLYIDRRIKYEIISVEIMEGNWWTITVKITDSSYKGQITLIYHSPNSEDAPFMDFLEEICNNNLLSDNVIILGDFNIDMKVNGHIQKKLIKIMNTMGLKQMINKTN